MESFSFLPTSPFFANFTRIQQPLLSASDAPAFIALPRSEFELQQALSCASEAGLQVGIKSGGHSFAAYSRVPAPGFMISLERMTAVELDEINHTVKVTGAARWADVYDAFSHSSNRYQVVGGLCPTVGVVGYTSGGGVGPLARQYGLAADNLLSFRLVLANGSRVLQVDSENYSDLFFAVRGSGGGQFGVISELTFQAHQGVPLYTWGSICFQNSTQQVLQTMALYADSLPRTVNLDAEIDSADSICLWVVAALPKAETIAALDAFLQPTVSGSQPNVTFNEMDCFWETIQAFADAKGYSATSDQPFVLTSVMLPALDNETAAAVAAVASQLPSDACGQSLIQFGGRIREISVNSSAFPWRDSDYMLYASCGFDASQPTSRTDMMEAMQLWHDAIRSVARGSYVNFIDANLQDWESQYFGSNVEFLRQIKATYNPPGVGPLRFAQEIGAQAEATSTKPVSNTIKLDQTVVSDSEVARRSELLARRHSVGKKYLPREKSENGRQQLALSDDDPFFPVGGNIWPIAIYYTYIHVGTPSELYCVAIDTGSTTTAVPDASCTSCSNNTVNLNYYSSAKSSSSKLIQQGGYGGSYQTCEFADPGATCSDSGDLYSDSVGIGSTSLNGYQFGSITSMTSNFDQFKFCNGIMGLFGDTLFSELVGGGQYSENVFGMCLSATQGVASNGSINFGGVDTQLFDGEIQWTPNVDGTEFYQINVNGAGVSGQSLLSSWSGEAILDSGTNGILLASQQPMDDLKAAYLQLCAHSPIHGVCDAPSNATLFDGACFSFTDAQVSSFPSLTISLANSTTLVVNGDALLNQYDPLGPNPQLYCLGIAVAPEAGYIIGDVVMANKYVIFDNSNNQNLRIGWATASAECGSQPLPKARTASAPTAYTPQTNIDQTTIATE